MRNCAGGDLHAVFKEEQTWNLLSANVDLFF